MPKLGALHDGYLQNKDISFRLVTNMETESLEDTDTLKKIAEDHSERINKLERKCSV